VRESMRRNRWRLFAGAAVAVILAVQPATADDADTCAKAFSGDEAIAACTRLISSGRYNGRDLAIIYTNRGNAWGGDLDRPIADYKIRDYDQAIRLDPTYVPAYIKRGYAWGSKDLDRAIADYTEVIRLDPTNALAYYYRGYTWGAKGDNERAIADYDQAIGLDPNARALTVRCRAHAIAGNLPQALSDCDEAYRLRPNDGYTMASRCFIYLRLGRLDDAIVEYDAAAKRSSSTAFTLFGRGIAKQRKGDTAGGDADMIAAKIINPKIAKESATKYGLQ
jgi:tetratricopeptide (TPR) repeat protein